MAIERDTVLIVDIESTCWKKHKNPPGEQSEIIEIGICSLHIASGEIKDKKSIFIKPTESTVSPFCTKLTTITPEMLDEQGISFEDACQQVQSDYQTHNRLWISWGNYDRKMFQKQCERRGVDYPFSDNHCNLKNMFANMYTTRIGMAAALKKIGLELEGTQHRGDDDAYNIARILRHMLETYGTDMLDSFWE